ncbi:MAG: hypothetical protein FD143_2733 [Ignavibacteria bacterium]|nr:MAG: hypothetical protein FD143_2733 [Ignavibacteria bacterium]KAF0157625.1 MAG: hypothetical protein FD188_2724 [Ignavibacteria bacterium]
MYASILGKRLIEIYNEGKEKKVTPKKFLDEIYFPLFYDHEKYFHWTINSPFVQGYKSANPPDKEQRAKKLAELHEKISTNMPDASFAIGFGAADDTATTSSQITSLKLPISHDDIYSSWIGAGVGIGVSGGLVMLINNLEILKIIFEGWTKYRELLNETNALKGNQIETWNGQWLTFALNNNDYKRQKFAPVEIKNEVAIIPTQSWIKVLFALARKFPNEKLNAYIYSLGQTNTTVGFIQINLPEIKREIEMYDYLFGEMRDVGKRAIDEVYNTQFIFRTACQNGVIGLQEIQPKDLKEYFPQRNKEAVFPKIKNDEKSIINYNIYLSWVIAMLNNKTTIQAAEETAKILLSYVTQTARAKKTQSNKVNTLLESSTRKSFIESLTEIIKDDSPNGDFFNSLVEEIDKMQADKFPYFLTLVKFKYTFLNNRKS